MFSIQTGAIGILVTSHCLLCHSRVQLFPALVWFGKGSHAPCVRAAPDLVVGKGDVWLDEERRAWCEGVGQVGRRVLVWAWGGSEEDGAVRGVAVMEERKQFYSVEEVVTDVLVSQEVEGEMSQEVEGEMSQQVEGEVSQEVEGEMSQQVEGEQEVEGDMSVEVEEEVTQQLEGEESQEVEGEDFYNEIYFSSLVWQLETGAARAATGGTPGTRVESPLWEERSWTGD